MRSEQENIVLKPKKKTIIDKINSLFENKKRRGLFLFLFMIPFIAGMVIFGLIAVKETKNLISLATGGTIIKEENQIKDAGYVLREDATDYQKELFAELKSAIEVEGADETTVAGLVAQNYIADFYTWTNKQGQYDVGGMYYVLDSEYEDGTHSKENIYQNARDNFYRYLSSYIKEYGATDLLEVENIQLVKCKKSDDKYVLNEHVENRQDEQGDWYDYREDHEYDAYEVTCSWTYKPTEKFDTSKYCKKINLVLIDRWPAFPIVEVSEKDINVKEIEIEEIDVEAQD